MLFNSLDIAMSGANLSRFWMDAISDNVANINTVRSTDQPAFQQRMVIAQSVGGEGGGVGDGARVAGIRLGDPEGRLRHDPDHPLADENGLVRTPDIELSDQMTHLIVAQRSYQANVTVFERARDAYQRALEIGR